MFKNFNLWCVIFFQFYAQVEFGNEIQISHDIIIGTVPLKTEKEENKGNC